MITLALDNPSDLAEAFYLALAAIDQLNGKPGPTLWRNTDPEERERWTQAAKRLIALYPAEGLTLGLLRD